MRGPVPGQAERGVEHRLVRHHAGGLDPAGGRHDHLGTRVVDPGRQLLGREPAEHHRVHRPQPRARQHRDHRLGHHRHVDHHPVALLHPQEAQHPGEPRDLVTQLGVRVAPGGAGHRAVVDQRDPVAVPRLDVPVQRVVAGVQLPVGKPPVEGRRPGVQHLARRPAPGDGLGRLRPEVLGIGDAAGEGVSVRHQAIMLFTARPVEAPLRPSRTENASRYRIRRS